jgi:hypothetical protein
MKFQNLNMIVANVRFLLAVALPIPVYMIKRLRNLFFVSCCIDHVFILVNVTNLSLSAGPCPNLNPHSRNTIDDALIL